MYRSDSKYKRKCIYILSGAILREKHKNIYIYLPPKSIISINRKYENVVDTFNEIYKWKFFYLYTIIDKKLNCA